MRTTEEDLYPHLSAKARGQVHLSDQERIEIIQQGSWISLDHAKKVLNVLEDLLQHPRVVRMDGLLLFARPCSGKTTILKHFCSLHPPVMALEAEATQMPVVMIESPPKADSSDLYSRILDKCMAVYRPNTKASEKCNQVKTLFRTMGVRMLIIDEIQHSITGTYTNRQIFKNDLKSLSNELQINLVLSGTLSAQAAVLNDDEFASRLGLYELPSWPVNKKLSELLATLEMRMPLREPSNLKLDDKMTAISERAETMLGDICDFVKKAGIQAIRTKSECITMEIIESIDFQSVGMRSKKKYIE